MAGVVNLITRKNFDGLELSINGRVPQHGGGETVSISLANGWNFGNGNTDVIGIPPPVTATGTNGPGSS